jgi:uracil-DNA glycosylase
VSAAAVRFRSVGELDAALVDCRACPRLVAWRELVAREKRAAFRDEDYWGRPVPGIGPPDAALLIVGLAPAAHGGNRTGRMFTGDRSGDVLFAALHAVGLANQPTAVHRDDGLTLHGTRITAPVHCAPPDNKPTPAERDTCGAWLRAELGLLTAVRAVVVLGAFGWQSLLPVLAAAGWVVPRPDPASAMARTRNWAGSAERCTCSAATTSASRTRSPAGSPRPCWRKCCAPPRTPPAFRSAPRPPRSATPGRRRRRP